MLWIAADHPRVDSQPRLSSTRQDVAIVKIGMHQPIAGIRAKLQRQANGSIEIPRRDGAARSRVPAWQRICDRLSDLAQRWDTGRSCDARQPAEQGGCHLRGIRPGNLSERSAWIEAFEEQNSRAGISIEQPDRTPAVPRGQSQRLGSNCFGELADLQDARLISPMHWHDNGKRAMHQLVVIHIKVPPTGRLANDARNRSKPPASRLPAPRGVFLHERGRQNH
jgi:hypothetical protein